MAKTMIEPYITEKLCSCCRLCKPVTEFSADSSKLDGYHYYCKSCRRNYAAARRAIKELAAKPEECDQGGESPTAWLLPADPRTTKQLVMAKVQKLWSYDVKPAANLVPSLGRWAA